MPFTAWLAVSEVGEAAWMLAVVQVNVLGVVVAVFVTVVGGDVAVATVCSRREVGGQGVSRGVVGWPGIECRHFRAAGGCFEDGGEAVVAVVNGVSDCDVAVTGCAGVVGCDTAVGNGDGRGMRTVQRGVIRDELGGSVDVPMFFRSRGSSSLTTVCMTASAVVVVSVCVMTSVVQVVVV
jgi:hypothetical protein